MRVSIFRGTDKSSPLFSVKEFGNTCLLLTLDKVLEYGDVLNLIQADEENRSVARKDVPLFDSDVYREAIINAFVHNRWVEGNAPMITVFSDRMEILSRGTLAPNQTIEGFFLGESVPVNQKLSDIFLQLHISERSGRGVPKITKVYGRDAFEFRENSISLTIPFNRVKQSEPFVGQQVTMDSEQGLSRVQQRVLSAIRNNPNITQPHLVLAVGVSKTTIYNTISFLKKNGYIERVGSNKTGYWRVL
jgi:predicted HTH transcriptional regulator